MIKHSDPKYCRAVIKKVLMRLYIGIQKQNIVPPVQRIQKVFQDIQQVT